MESTYLNPFVKAACDVLETMSMVTITPAEPYKSSDKRTFGALSGEISLAGTNVSGGMCIGFEEACIISLVNNMLGESYKEIVPEVSDALGEITNMITSGAKKQLAESGLKIGMAVPHLLHGENLPLWKENTTTEIYVLPFNLEYGKFEIKVWLNKVPKS